MAKKNQSADKSSKVISSTSAVVFGCSSDHEKQKNSNGSKELSEEERKEQFYKYKPTGDFEKDFVELCVLVGIPSLYVVARPKRAATPTIFPPETSMSKGKEDKKNAQPQEPPKISENNELIPTTYTVSNNKYEYFKPRVEVEMEEEASKTFVRELYVRGWQVDKRVIDVLSITMPELERLTVVDLWNAGLNDNTLLSLEQCLSTSMSLKTLRLDGNNHITSQRFDMFLSEKSSLQNISLKNCDLNDTGALHIGNSLRENKNLITLNLCFNKLTDKGASHLASGLRMNRSLLSLNLGSNNINDDGAKRIAEALSTFSLNHDEVVARRLLKSTSTNDDSSQSPGHSASYDRPPTASRSFSKDERKNKDKGGKKKESGNKFKDNGSVKRGPSNADTTKNQKGQKNKGSVKQERNRTPQQDVEDLYEFKNPLLEKVREINGELWVPGNRSLINLNLARNKIGEVGLIFLYTAMKYQVDLANETNRITGTGLMRLSLQKNAFKSDHQTFIQLNELMKTRDPFYKPPTPSPIEESNKEES